MNMLVAVWIATVASTLAGVAVGKMIFAWLDRKGPKR